ncbi:hypothetical protein Acr_20g0000640 [Actinidia rufa]|uniref:Uncharacterized protein n=1 Tax=Actinidia rufa TaxID=165716 RepID=A0A7J0GBR7_9ERIC|nr:hypothetical protein Acr_20g0000640 [Actinidia rufa]
MSFYPTLIWHRADDVSRASVGTQFTPLTDSEILTYHHFATASPLSLTQKPSPTTIVSPPPPPLYWKPSQTTPHLFGRSIAAQNHRLQRQASPFMKGDGAVIMPEAAYDCEVVYGEISGRIQGMVMDFDLNPRFLAFFIMGSEHQNLAFYLTDA